MHFHAVVWIDHREAHVLGFGTGEPSRKMIRSEGPEHIHHKAGTMGSGHVHGDLAYFAAVADAMNGFEEILIVGPAETRTEFRSYLNRNRLELAIRVIGVEPMSHASEGAIIDFAHRFFAHADRMTAQRKDQKSS